MKFIVINTKGGVGKSTVANQILSAFVHEKSGEVVNLVEFDDQNRDSEALSKSEILVATQEAVDAETMKSAIDANIVKKENLIIDVGGNKSSEMFLGEISKSIAKNMITGWVIPLTDGDMDTTNALATYNAIREISDKPIIFVLSRANSARRLNYQFFRFLGVNEDGNPLTKMGGYMEKHVAEEDQHYISIADSDVLPISRVMGKTIYELAAAENDYESQAMAKLEEGKNDAALSIMWMHGKQQDMVAYREKVINPAFKKLDEVFGGAQEAAKKAS